MKRQQVLYENRCPYCRKKNSSVRPTRIICDNCNCDFEVKISGKTEIIFRPHIYDTVYIVVGIIMISSLVLSVLAGLCAHSYVGRWFNIGQYLFCLTIICIILLVIIACSQAIKLGIAWVPAAIGLEKCYWYELGRFGKIMYSVYVVIACGGCIYFVLNILIRILIAYFLK